MKKKISFILVFIFSLCYSTSSVLALELKHQYENKEEFELIEFNNKKYIFSIDYNVNNKPEIDYNSKKNNILNISNNFSEFKKIDESNYIKKLNTIIFNDELYIFYLSRNSNNIENIKLKKINKNNELIDVDTKALNSSCNQFNCLDLKIINHKNKLYIYYSRAANESILYLDKYNPINNTWENIISKSFNSKIKSLNFKSDENLFLTATLFEDSKYKLNSFVVGIEDKTLNNIQSLDYYFYLNQFVNYNNEDYALGYDKKNIYLIPFEKSSLKINYDKKIKINNKESEKDYRYVNLKSFLIDDKLYISYTDILNSKENIVLKEFLSETKTFKDLDFDLGDNNQIAILEQIKKIDDKKLFITKTDNNLNTSFYPIISIYQ